MTSTAPLSTRVLPQVLAWALLLAALPQARGTVSIGVTADRLNDAGGNATPTSTLALLVVDTAGDGLAPAVAGSLASGTSLDGSTGDDIILFRTGLSAFSSAGALQVDANGLDLASVPGWEAGDPLHLVWFPGLTLADLMLNAGEAYGSIPLGATPTDGATESFIYVTRTDSVYYDPVLVPTLAPATTASETSVTSAPELVVTGNGTGISDGSSTPAAGNHTDFGSTIVGGAGVVRTFTVTNVGTASLTVQAPALSGPAEADFEVIQSPASPVAPGGATTFQIRFVPSVSGLRAATVSLGNNDGDENPFDFAIAGTGANSAPTDIGLSPGLIAENNLPGAAVGTLSATDADAADSHGFELVDGAGDTDNAAFTLDGSTLRLTGVADFEAKPSYTVRVRATDTGSPAQSFARALTVTVTNVNEAPTAVSLTGGTLAENGAPGATAGTLQAIDPDAGDTVGFTLASGPGDADNGSFTILGNALRLTSPANFEAKSAYQVRVRATDSGGLPLENAFTVTVTNVNEAPDGLALNPSAIAENNAPGTAVGTLTATDPDAGDTAAFSLVSGSGGADNGSFTVVGSELRLAVAANFETQDSYQVRVRVTDSGSLPFEAPVTVTVTNVNEAPAQLVLSEDTIAENSPAGTTVGVLDAEDPDAGDTLTFSLASGSGDTDNGSFTIQGAALKIAETPDFEIQDTYLVRVRATDGGNPGLFTEAAFTVSVTDVDETPGDIILSAATVAENQAVGTTVGTLGIVDPTAVAPVSFALVAGAGGTDNASFSIAGNALLLQESADFEDQASYSIRVRSTDSSTPIPRSTTEVFVITVTNQNEAPSGLALANASIAENNVPGATVGLLSAQDPDAGDVPTFSLVSGTGSTDNNRFTIEGSALKLLDSANFEAKSSYAVRVLATDTGSPGLTTEAAFQVSVTDVNEAPVFTAGGDRTLASTTTAPQSVPGWATGIDDGDAAVTQALSFAVTVTSGAGRFSVPPAVSPTGELTFTPSGTAGTANLSVTLTDDASISGTAALTTGPQTFVIRFTRPEIVVRGNATVIADGDATPSMADHTDFGTTPENGGMVTRGFEITNDGDGDLTLGQVTISGPHAEDFTVTQPPGSPVAPTGSSLFQVTFDPQAPGLRQATVSFANGDQDATPFDFSIQGNGGTAEIAVEADGADLGDGTAELTFAPSPDSPSPVRVLTIRNLGDAPLTGLSLALSGANPGDFTVSAPAASQLAPGAPPVTVNVTFVPSTSGERTAILQIASSDTNENPFDIALTGTSDGRLTKPVDAPSTEAPAPVLADMAWDNAVAGTYDGLLHIGDDLAGAVSDLLVSAAPAGAAGGAVSGTVRLNGVSYPLRGAFGTDGRLLSAPGALLGFDLQLSRTGSAPNQGEAIEGTVTVGSVTADAFLPRAPFSVSNPVPAALAATGAYTMLVPSEPGWGTDEPGGDGWATVSLSSTGVLTFRGRLGDATPFTETALLSAGGQASLYAEVSSTTPAGRLGGVLSFRNEPGSDFDGPLQWRKFENVGEARYANGFNVAVWAVGSRFTPPAPGVRVLSQLADQHHNAEVSLLGPTAPLSGDGALDKVMSWLSNNQFIHYGPVRLTGSASRLTGAVSGTLHDPASRTLVGFSGVALQKQGIVGGVFVNGASSGAVRILPGVGFSMPGSEDAGPLARLTKPAEDSGDPDVTAASASAAAAGTYGGILTDALGQLVGALESLVVTATGTYSGSLWVDGIRFTLRGTLDVPVEVGDHTVTLNLVSVDDTAGFALRGSVDTLAESRAVDAQRRPDYTRTSPSPRAGAYTMAVCAPDGVDVDSAPGGDGCGVLTVDSFGRCTGLVILADGTRVSLAGHHGEIFDDAGTSTAEWSFHRGLYGRVPRGFLVGKLAFREVSGISDLDGEWRWRKQAGASTTEYPGGFDTVREVVGSRYLAPATGVRALDGLENGPDNIWIRFAGPDLSTLAGLTWTEQDFAGTWPTNNRPIHYGPRSIEMTFNPRNGLLTGTYRDTANGVNVSIAGAVIQGQAEDLLTGHYLAQGKSGLFVIEERE